MVNTRAKGNRIERKAEDRLENQGFECSRMPHTRYGDSDHYNIIDIIAIKPGAKPRMVQVKSNQKPAMKQFKQKVLEIAPLKHVEILIYIWHDYVGWEIYKLNPETQKWDLKLDETQKT